jgi:hypothetical protein
MLELVDVIFPVHRTRIPSGALTISSFNSDVGIETAAIGSLLRRKFE